MTKNNIKSGQLVKEQHLNTLLKHLILDDCTTRIGLAKKTGLTKMTVTNLVNELIQNKLICETGTQESKDSLPGRRPIYLVVHPEAPHIIDVTIGRDFLSISRVDMKLNIIIQQKIKLSGENLQSLLHKIESELEYVIRYKPNDILGIGVVTPGPVDAENGLIINPPNFFGINNFNICRYLKDKFKIPTYIQKDGNACALAEQMYGKGKNIGDFIYFLATQGVGVGIITNHRLLNGRRSSGAEIGHTCIDPNGELCYCGNRGCLETFINQNAVLAKFNAAFGKDFTDFSQLLAFCDTDAEGEKLLFRCLDHLIIGLINAVNILDCEAIIIGGVYAQLSDKYFAYIESEINNRILLSGYKRVQLMRASIASAQQALGGACTVLYHYLKL